MYWKLYIYVNVWLLHFALPYEYMKASWIWQFAMLLQMLNTEHLYWSKYIDIMKLTSRHRFEWHWVGPLQFVAYRNFMYSVKVLSYWSKLMCSSPLCICLFEEMQKEIMHSSISIIMHSLFKKSRKVSSIARGRYKTLCSRGEETPPFCFSSLELLWSGRVACTLQWAPFKI